MLTVTSVLTGRTLPHSPRRPGTSTTTAVTPDAIVLLCVYVLGGAIHTGSDSYVTYLLPGILLITIASGVAYTAFRLFTDVSGGIVERLQSMPIARSALLWGHVLTPLAANLVSAVTVALGARLRGFPPGTVPPPWPRVARTRPPTRWGRRPRRRGAGTERW